MITLDDALKNLAEMDPRKSQVVEIKFFDGLTPEEVAEVLKVTPRTVERVAQSKGLAEPGAQQRCN